MKKIAITLSLTTLLLGGLIGCGTDADREGTGGLARQDQRGFGYHSTDQRTEDGGTGQRVGEGPITDMFTRDDRRGATGFGRDARQPATELRGQRGTIGQRGITGQEAGMRRTHEGVVRTREFGGAEGFGAVGKRSGRGTEGMGGETDIGIRDQDGDGAGIVGNRPGYVDNHGILRDRGTEGRTGTQGTGMRQFSYPNGYDADTVQRITTRLADVDNVRDTRVIVDEDRILVGVSTTGQDSKRIEQDVRRTVENIAGDKEVIVVTERDQYNQVRAVDDRLRGGEAFEEVGSTVNEMFRDFGRAIQRPFERTR